MEVHERLARGEEFMKDLRRSFEEHKAEADKRISKCEDMHESLSRLANSMERNTEKLEVIETDLKETKAKVNELEGKPGKASIKAWIWLICLVGGAILNELFDLIVASM